jgi:PAS domain S-box-containing protein
VIAQPRAVARPPGPADAHRAGRFARGLAERMDLVWRSTALIVVDDDRCHRRVNPAAGRLFGAEPELVVGTRIDDFTPCEHLPHLEVLWKELRERGELRGTYEMLRADQSRITVEFHATRDFAPREHLICACWLVGPQDVIGGATPVAVLSARECQVLQLAADGGSRRHIAEVLIISAGTVKSHFENIYAKLGVSDRAAAVAAGIRRGLIT